MTPAKAALEAQSAKSADVRANGELPPPEHYEHTSLAEALVAAQAQMPAVEKTARANYGMYATLDHLIAKTRPVLNRHGLSISQWPTYLGAADGDQLYPALETQLMHASGEVMSSIMPLILGKNDMQGLGSALTYAKRYAWAAALGISTDEDDDGNAASRPEVNPQRASQGVTGAARTHPQPRNAPAPVRASDTELEEYRAEVEAAGFDWLTKYETMSAVEIAELRERLAAHVAQKAAEAEA